MNWQAKERIEKRMSRIDCMPKELRELVHEHGLTVVDAFIECGVMKASRIRHLINVVKNGSYEIGDRTDNKNLMTGAWRATHLTKERN